MEALEIGVSLFIIDEDSSSPELMDRDARRQALIPPERETVTTFVDVLPDVRDRLGISTIIAASSGDYLEVADTVIIMEEYQARSGNEAARRIVSEHPSGRTPDLKNPPERVDRTPLSHSLEPDKPSPQDRFRPSARGYVQYGGEFIDCTRVTQLVSVSQSRAIARAIALVHRFMDSSKSLRDAVGRVMERVDGIGLDTLSGRLMGDLARFRAYELAAAVNRMKRLKVK
jgi:predicted ABC-class ATPase